MADAQPPPYSQHWQNASHFVILPSDSTNEEVVLPDYELSSVDYGSQCLIDSELSPYFNPKIRQRCFADKVESGHSTDAGKSRPAFSPYPHFSSEDGCDIPPSRKSSWRDIIKKKHSRKHIKSASIPNHTNPICKFTAIPIPTSPPKLRNQILLRDDTIHLSDPTGHVYFGSVQITLKTTLLEDRPYTIYSNVLHRDQGLQASLSHFEVFDTETGHVLSGKPRPSQPFTNIATTTTSSTHRPQPSTHASSSSGGTILRSSCTELTPHRSSLLTITAYPTLCRTSAEQVFSGLRIPDPRLLVGRQLGLRLRASPALWSASTIGGIFGYADSVVGWPDLYYGRCLMVRCGEGDGGEEVGWAPFRVVE